MHNTSKTRNDAISCQSDTEKQILFVMRYPLEDAYNLKQKFDGQMQAFINMGYQVWHLAYDTIAVYLRNVNTNKKELVGKTHFAQLPNYRSTFGFLDLYINLLRVSKKHSFRYIYMRSKPIDAIGLQALKILRNKGSKLIVEIPSYNSKETEISQIRKIVSFALGAWQSKFIKCVDLFTLIGANHVNEYRGKPAITIENGICLETIPARRACSNSDSIHLLALASMRYWQGYDRVIEGLAAYQGNEIFVLHMVGPDDDGSLSRWKALAEEKGVIDSVCFHGASYGDALCEVFNMCEVGIGTLGLYRKQTSIGSVLKIREYTARGLPFIYGYEDTALSGDEVFALRVPDNGQPIDMDQLIEWRKNVLSQGDIVTVMRTYAQRHMSWESQFNKVIQTIER